MKFKKKNRTGRRSSSSSRRRTATTSKEWTKRGETKKTRMRSRWKASGGGVSGQSASNDSAPARQSGGWSRPATGRGIPRPLVLHRGNNNNNKNQTKNRKKAQKRTREREREREREKGRKRASVRSSVAQKKLGKKRDGALFIQGNNAK